MTTVTPALQSALLNLSNVFVPSARGQNQTRGTYYTSEDFLQCGIMLITANGKLYNNYVMGDDAAQIFATYDVTHDAIQTFHKSWEKVANEDYVTLLAEQIAHYFSTYGLEAEGYRALPLVPVEELIADPNARPSFKSFRPVLVMSSIGAQKVIDTTLRSTKAPHRMKMKYYEEYVKNTTLTDSDIASFELRIMWYKHNNTVPQNGQDFIRYALYTLTGATLIIKNNRTITSLKRAIQHNCDVAYGLLSKANPFECAKVFHRFKPFFLAFKQEERCKFLVNRIRRLAETYHQPLSDVSIQNFSKLCNEGRITECRDLLQNTSMRNLIKLYNFYSDRVLMNKNDNISAFNIRNGKIHIEEDCKIGVPSSIRLAFVNAMRAKANNIYKDKIFYIPDYIIYTAPTTEKQFLGAIPNGTIVCGPQNKAFSAAICWDNYKGRRTDLDLHMVGVDRSYGWNSLYRDNDENAVLYSGDMTDATYGAAEAFYFKPNGRDFVLTANNFTGEIGVPFKFFISESKPVQRNWRYTPTPPIDVESAIFPPIPLNFPDPNGCTLGMFIGSDFVFYNGSLDMGRVPDRSRYPDFIKAMKRKFNGMMSLHTYLSICGARVVSDLSLLTEEEQKKVIDLSPENLTTETLMNLVDIDK